MANYYCLMAGAPDLKLNTASSQITLPEFREEMNGTLNDRDKELTFFFFLQRDCMNIVKLLENPDAEIVCDGNYTIEQYRDLITSAREMNFNVHRYPAFMSIFAREYQYNKDKQNYFPKDAMMFEFYSYAMQCRNSFISRWYELNLNINNILTALTARKHGWQIADYIQGEGDIVDMILNNNTKDFDLSNELDYVADLMKIVECEDPVEKEKQIDAFKWLWLEEETFMNIFSIEAVFAYLCKLEMLERWEKLDPQHGQETFRQIIENLRGEAKVPEEYLR